MPPTKVLACAAALLAPAIAPATPSPDVDKLLGLPAGTHATFEPTSAGPQTGFFLAEGYSPEMAVPADTVQLYIGGPEAPDEASRKRWLEIFKSWKQKGYFVQAFLHSRSGSLIDAGNRNVQTNRDGQLLTYFNVKAEGKVIDAGVGPIRPEVQRIMEERHKRPVLLEQADRYQIPTLERIQQARRYYQELLTDDVSGFCFDEPEIWCNAGYSEAFKAEWQAHYGTPWQAPHESVDARVKAEQLKAFLVRRWVESVLDDVKRRRPGMTTLLALHSQSGYLDIGMGAPHSRLFSIPSLDEVIAEVWNLPFDASYLQYSSFQQQLRGTGKRIWFMTDPWGDSVALSYEYYTRSYADNLVSALMFPGVDRFQPQIWPSRLYGKIDKQYETVINTAAGALLELRRHDDGRLEAGSRGFGTFVSDSMSWQRAEPAPSDFDGHLGLASPLVLRGVPTEAYSLDRVAEPGYLDGARCLLLSYDFLKPMDEAHNRALADWTRQGGALVVVGGTDAYNALKDSWWAKAGAATPTEELAARLGIPLSGPRVFAEAGRQALLEPVAGLTGASPLRVPLGPTPGQRQWQRRINLWQIEFDDAIKDPTYPITIYPLPSGAEPLYRLRGDGGQGVVAWQKRVGRGLFMFVGVSPGLFKTSPAGADFIRGLAAHAYRQAGSVYEESPRMLVRRGPYVAVRTMDEASRLPGRYVDLLSPKLEVLDDPLLPAKSSMFLECIGAAGFPPRPIVSGRLKAHHESSDLSAFLVSAPSRTQGVARLLAAGRKVRAVSGRLADGGVVEVATEAEGDTLLLRYPNNADGVAVRVEWDAGSASVAAPARK